MPYAMCFVKLDYPGVTGPTCDRIRGDLKLPGTVMITFGGWPETDIVVLLQWDAGERDFSTFTQGVRKLFCVESVTWYAGPKDWLQYVDVHTIDRLSFQHMDVLHVLTGVGEMSQEGRRQLVKVLRREALPETMLGFVDAQKLKRILWSEQGWRDLLDWVTMIIEKEDQRLQAQPAS